MSRKIKKDGIPLRRMYLYFWILAGIEQLSLAALVRHLDQSMVMDNPELKTGIVEVIVQLARQSKVKATVAVIGAMNDLVGHLRKSLEASKEAAKLAKVETLNLHKGLQHALEECLMELAKRVQLCFSPLFCGKLSGIDASSLFQLFG